MPPTISAFTPNDLVISIYGDGDGSGAYTLDQAAPITLEELTTTGAVAGQLVLPETATTSGTTIESAISGEYGSASEGTLQLSSDGRSLTVFGYGVNDVAFNQGAAAIYGNAALGQSTSVKGGVYTAVPRVVADISYNGAVDTSTALYNIYNTNNPRSVATVNGTTFDLSGQSTKGSTTQGVFSATDGSQSATAIDTSLDTRTAEIYNGVLYVSRDSTQSTTSGSGISSYGSAMYPNSGTTLAGINGTVTLAAAQANTVDGGAAGTVVNLSPENFVYANATTLYVADSGFPKQGGIGDGGLQKWTYNGSAWTLDYTLSLGLNLVADTAAAGTTGLFGLTGIVSGGTVQLYATTSTVNELDPSFLYGIADVLTATTAPAGKAFTQLAAAAPDTIIRGVSFAPTAPTNAVSAITVSSGIQQAVTVSSGVSVTVSSGASFLYATVLSGGSVVAFGNDNYGLLAHGGTETVFSQGDYKQIDGNLVGSGPSASVDYATVNNGGSLTLLGGAIGTYDQVGTGGLITASGGALVTSLTIGGGTLVLQSPDVAVLDLDFAGPGVVRQTALPTSRGGFVFPISGFGTGDVIDVTPIGQDAMLTATVAFGNTYATISGAAGIESLTFSGSIASSLALTPDSTGGEQIVFVPPATTSVTLSAGTTSSGLIVSSGSTLTINSGATIISATILAGGNETVLGTASGGQVYGTQLVSAATAVVTGETVFNGGFVDLYLKGATANNLTVSSGGAFNISGNASGTNTTLAGGATLALQSPKATLSGSLTLSGAGNTLLVAGAISSGFGDLAVISGFNSTDSIDAATIAGGAVLTATTSGGNTVETITSGAASESFIFAGLVSGFSLGSDDNNGTLLTVAAPCYCPGTLIATATGEAPVETLAIGDLVRTVSGALEPIRWIGRRSYAGRALAGQRHLLPVRIRAGALGGGLPRRDLRVSPLHAMFLDGVLVPASELVNRTTIVQEADCRAVHYIHIELARHDVILAEGAPSETFLDTDNSRALFHNAADHAARYPAAAPPGLFCAPRVESGFVLQAIRTRLAA